MSTRNNANWKQADELYDHQCSYQYVGDDAEIPEYRPVPELPKETTKGSKHFEELKEAAGSEPREEATECTDSVEAQSKQSEEATKQSEGDTVE